VLVLEDKPAARKFIHSPGEISILHLGLFLVFAAHWTTLKLQEREVNDHLHAHKS
jgi:hypothetical protein